MVPYSRLLHVDMSIRTGWSITGWMYSGSGQIRIKCISGSGKIRFECISVLPVSDQPNGFEALFGELFLFLSKSKFDIFIT